MWLMLYDCFFSIVKKDCNPSQLLVRARRPGDIEKVFKGAKVTEALDADYRYRAVVPRIKVIEAMSIELGDIEYPNFKSAVADRKLHNAYLDVWTTMSRLQPTPPYSVQYKKRKK